MVFLLYSVKGKKNALQRQYVLPDGIKHKRGFVKEPEPVKPDKVRVLHSPEFLYLRWEQKNKTLEVLGILYLGLFIYPISFLFASAFVLTFVETGIVATLILTMYLGW